LAGKKSYSDYHAYQYLRAGKDYRAFELAPEIGRVPTYCVPVSDDEERRVQELLRTSVVISLHDHPVILPKDVGEILAYKHEGRAVTAYKALSQSHMDAIVENFMDGTCFIHSKNGWKWIDVIHDIGMRFCDLAHQDLVIQCETVDDIHYACQNGKIALIPGLEAATMVENEVDRIDILFGLGIRMMGIVYSEANNLGSGLSEDRDGGLSHFGRQAVERMNQLGMAIDVSHASDQTCLDAIEASTRPIMISHAGARALWESKRMKPDDVLTACAQRGGLIGIEASPHTSMSKAHPLHSIDSVMDHFQYCIELIGIDHVAFGPDTMYGDHVAIHHAFAEAFSIEHEGGPPYTEVEYVKGIENPTEAFPNIARWLVHHGYSNDEIRKVIGGNILRLLKEIWPR